MIKETEILVIIGYSLADFNRDIDRDIFSNDSAIKNVYLQVNNDENFPKNMRALKNDFLNKLEIVPHTTSFHLPAEF